MTRIILSGVNGRMGRAIEELCEQRDDMEICAGVDVNLGIPHRFPTARSFEEITEEADVIIDFSHHSVTEKLLEYSIKRNIPAVICTTGHTEEELSLIDLSAQKTALFKSANMSLGVNVMISLAKRAAEILENFDIEIVEKHHNKKLDAPSGTALMIADEIRNVLPYDAEYVYDRTKERKAREKKEIGIHAVRGGNIVGDHDVIYAGTNEVLTISHSAMSREVFASGALAAAKFMKGKTSGMYSMCDIVGI